LGGMPFAMSVMSVLFFRACLHMRRF